MRTPDLRSERGMALLLAIVALVVIGALVAGTFFISSIEQKTANNTAQSGQAFQAAEAGMQDAIGSLAASSYTGISANDSLVLTSTALGGSIYQAKVFPLNSKLFLVKSMGTNAGVSQTLASVVQLVVPNVKVKASLSVTAPVTFNGTAFRVSGVDSLPANSSGCPVPYDSVYGIRSSTSTGMGSQDINQIKGTGGYGSAVANDTSVASLVNSVFGSGGTYDALKASVGADTFSAGTYNGFAPSLTATTPQVCNTADRYNWGEPNVTSGYVSQCSNYFPTVLGKSTFGNPFKITGGRGQGVLLADGDLEISGNFVWNGLIIVKGSFKITGTGSGSGGTKIIGAVIAQNGATVDDNTLSGNTSITYSSCAISNALKGSGSVIPLGQRSWTQIY